MTIRNTYLSQKDLIIAALHQVLLERKRVLHIRISPDHINGEALQLRVELCHAVLGQQEQQVEPQQLVHER